MMNQVFDDMPINFPSKFFDDDGRPKRTGDVWTTSAHIITAVIGSGVLSLPWAVAQLGWVAGVTVLFMFSFITYYTSVLLATCYRDPDSGKRNYTYMEAVKSILGGFQFKLCGAVQQVNLVGAAIGYTIASAISMKAIERSNCYHKKGHDSRCGASSDPYMIAFGVMQIIFSQIPDFDEMWWLSGVAAVMSFTYSTIGLGLGIAKVAENRKIKGSLTGISVGTITKTQKTWRVFQALGSIAFAYAYSIVLIEIQDTIKSPPSEYKTMKKATFISIAASTVFFMLCACSGYAAFGDTSPGNLLTGFGFYNPYWLLNIANVAIVIHLVGAYQVYCQPLFAFVEKSAHNQFPDCKFINIELTVPIPGLKAIKLNLFRLIWRTTFVIIITLISMLMPFFNDVVGLLGAIGFWPLTVYFPVEMYIRQNKIEKWSAKWIVLQSLSGACFVISLAAAVGSVAGVVSDLQVYKPFKTSY
ncbi:hypothetical protein ACS0TY_036815 [Phlomoides rotata]